MYIANTKKTEAKIQGKLLDPFGLSFYNNDISEPSGYKGHCSTTNTYRQDNTGFQNSSHYYYPLEIITDLSTLIQLRAIVPDENNLGDMVEVHWIDRIR